MILNGLMVADYLDSQREIVLKKNDGKRYQREIDRRSEANQVDNLIAQRFYDY